MAEGIDIPPANMSYENQTPGGGGMGYYDPNYGYGGGGATRNVVGLLAGLGGNLLFPGAGLVLGPLAKFAAGQFQRSGGQQDPMSGATTVGTPQPSSSSKGSGSGAGTHYSAGGIPAPGGWGGVYGQGSGGNLGKIGTYYGNLALKRLLSGGDTSLGWQGLPNANATAGAPTLPIELWGGALNKNFGNEGGNAVGADFKGKSSN